MALNLVVGKSNCGKTEYIMKKSMACNTKQAILFVPSSMRVMAEQEYLKFTKKKGIVDIIITSIERFVDKNVDKNKLYQNKEYLPELAKKLLIKKVILENNDLFEIFAKVKNNPNFVDRVYSYIDSAKREKISSKDILDKYTDDDYLGKKIKEFGNIYEKVESTLKEKFISSVDEIEYYIEEIVNDNSFKGYNIFFDGYNNFSKVEYEYIKAMLLSGADVTIALLYDKENYELGITELFNTTHEVYEYLKNMCVEVGVNFNEINLNTVKQNRPKDIEFLATNMFSLSKNVYKQDVRNIKLILKENTYNELEYIATDITEKIKQGYKYSDIVIYTNDIDHYITGIKRIFNKYDIPVYFNSQKSIYSNNLITYLILMLNIISKGLKKDITPFLSLVKTGILELQYVNEFENYVREFGIKGYDIYKKITQNNKSENSYIYDIDKINLLREIVLEKVENLKNKLEKANTSKAITEAIYNHLIENDILNKYEQQLQVVKNENTNEYNRQKQVIAELYKIMDSIVIAYDSISLSGYIELLEYSAKEVSIDTIPEKIDQVFIADINKNRGTEKKVGYIIGAYDGGLPSIQNEDNVFSDAELEKLKQKNIDLKQTKVDRNNMQLFNIYQALNKIREKLIITVPATKMAGGSLRPSPLINSIKNMLNIKLESCETKTDLNVNSNFMDFLTRLLDINEETNKETIEEIFNEYLFYMNDEKYRKILEYSRTDNNLKKETLDLIYKDKINSSVSRLEQFKRCPFAYYSKYVLNLRENKEYQVTSLDLGSLMHGVLEEFSKYILSKNISWQDIILNEECRKKCYKEIENIVENIFNENYSKYTVTSRYIVLKNKIKTSMKNTVYAISDSFNHSSFRPLGYEIEFENGALFAPIKIELDDGKEILLRGKIDRVDSASINGNTYLRIVDYKSSNRDLKLTDIKDGISLQLMTYMWAMLENSKKVSNTEPVIPAALNYFTISSKLLGIPFFEEDKSKVKSLIRNALKLKGIYIKDIHILKELDNNYNDKDSYLAVSSLNINNDKKNLSEDVFKAECKNMNKILKEIASDIINGNVTICPNKKIKDTCKYCKFNTICRKDILN